MLHTVLSDQGVYGFGDIQYENIITSLKRLFTGFNPVRLSKKGTEILYGTTSYYSSIRNNEVYLGGALKYSYLYNIESNNILKSLDAIKAVWTFYLLIIIVFITLAY